jgi:hypothetical protein
VPLTKKSNVAFSLQISQKTAQRYHQIKVEPEKKVSSSRKKIFTEQDRLKAQVQRLGIPRRYPLISGGTYNIPSSAI